MVAEEFGHGRTGACDIVGESLQAMNDHASHDGVLEESGITVILPPGAGIEVTTSQGRPSDERHVSTMVAFDLLPLKRKSADTSAFKSYLPPGSTSILADGAHHDMGLAVGARQRPDRPTPAGPHASAR